MTNINNPDVQILAASYPVKAGTFLIEVIFGLLILLVALRFLFQLARADAYNPISQAVIKLTTPLLRPFRKIIPGFGGVDVAALVLLYLLEYSKNTLIILISAGKIPFLALAIISIFKLLGFFIMIYIVAILIMVIASWIVQDAYNPVLKLIFQLTNPVLAPFRRIIPSAGGIDFSPLAAMVVLTLLNMAIPYLTRAALGAG